MNKKLLSLLLSTSFLSVASYFSMIEKSTAAESPQSENQEHLREVNKVLDAYGDLNCDQLNFKHEDCIEEGSSSSVSMTPPVEAKVAKQSVKADVHSDVRMGRNDLAPGSENSMTDEIDAKSKTKEFSLAIAPEISYYTYREPSLAVTIAGGMYGINGRYIARPKELVDEIVSSFGAEGRYSYGQMSYNGSGKANEISDTVFDIKGWVGKDYYYKNVHFMPYFGFGYRHLYDAGAGIETMENGITYSGYNRRSRYFYIPVGFDTTFHLPNGFKIQPIIEYDIFLTGRQISYVSDFYGVDFSNRQTSGHGFNFSTRFSKSLDNIDLFVEPFFRFWHIQQSLPVIVGDSVNGYVFAFEPDNNTKEFGMKVGAEF